MAEMKEKFVEYSCQDFVDALSSAAPVPGGGGGLGLAASAGMALNNMVCNLTIGKKKYAEVEDEIKDILARGEELKQRLLYIVQLDAAVFEPLSKAYGLPTETDAEKDKKKEVISNCSKKAAEVPVMAAEMCVAALRLTARTAEIGSRLVISDSGCAGALLLAALKCARLNVLINLGGIQEEELALSYKKRIDELLAEGEALAAKVEEAVLQLISK